MFIFARENAKFTRFLIGNEEAFDRYFKQTTYNEEGIEKLYMLRDVYNQITLIVDSVSTLTIYVAICVLLHMQLAIGIYMYMQ